MSGLEKEFPGRVKAKNVDATTRKSLEAIRGLGFNNHGLVIRGSDGSVLHKQPDHAVDLDEARKALRELTKTSP